MRTYLLYEPANFHGGSTQKIHKLIDVLPNPKNAGIKFQIFKYDEIARPDYEWFNVYKRSFINKAGWRAIIAHARKKRFDVWLDIFDAYSLAVLKNNSRNIRGLKLQSSVLENITLLRNLALIIAKKKSLNVIINIAGRETEDIAKVVGQMKNDYFQHNIIILQTGFQAYPTKPSELLLNKIRVLKKYFPMNVISYADHIEGSSPLALTLPASAVLAGAEHIEKHVCLDRANTKYDYHSALEVAECESLIKNMRDSEQLLGTHFLSPRELAYLSATIEKPLAAEDLAVADLILLDKLAFKRTSQRGLRLNEIKKLMRQCYILAKPIKKYATLNRSAVRPARIGVIIACRMKATRLKHKATAMIGDYNAIERCIINAKKIKSAAEVILATSTLAEDQVLKKYARKHKIRFFAGDPDDVIKRFLGAADKYKLDVVIRITGDCPVVSYEMADFLVHRHFARGNDYTGPKEFAVGQNSEVYNVNAFKKIIKYLGGAPHSEYMTWYMLTNQDIFQVDMAELPREWVRGYRITLDEPADLDMFRALFKKLGTREPSLKNIFYILDNNPAISKLNSSAQLKYVVDKELIKTLNKETRIKLRS